MRQPSKPFLSSKVKFEWTAEVNEAFEKSKLEIVCAIENGVDIYDLVKDTCLCSDWSKKRIGYLLYQKQCVLHQDTVNVVGELHWPDLLF